MQRVRLVIGTLLCIAVIPATVTVVNFTWLREQPRWEFLRASHVVIFADWFNSVTGLHLPAPRLDRVLPGEDSLPQTPPPPDTVTPPGGIPVAKPAPFPSILLPDVVSPEQSTPSWKLTFKLLERLAKAYTWVGSVLLLVGLACGWRIFLRPEHLTLFCMNLLLLVITRIRYSTAGLDLRYFMPMVIVGIPWMALGMEYLVAGARRLAQRRGELSPRALRILTGSLIAVAVTCSFLDGPMPAAAYMRKYAALGRWIRNHAGPAPAMAGYVDALTLETFYANGRVVGTFGLRDCLLVPMPAAITERKADVVVLWNQEHVAHEHLAEIRRRITYYRYRPVDEHELPVGNDELMVFVREP